MRAVVVTVSDRVSSGQAEDRSGPRAAAMLREMGFEVDVKITPDGVEPVIEALTEALEAEPHLIITTGGTGLSPRDLTPEATRKIIEREVPGLAEAMRSATFGRNPHGMLSRGVVGTVGTTLIVNLPGSVGGVEESLEVIEGALDHAVALLRSESTDHGVFGAGSTSN